MAVDLAEILSMLQERSQRGRNLVFRHVADLFLAGKVPHLSGDRAVLLEALRILRPKVDIGIRRELSGHLYSMERPPQGLLDLLLDDADEVSGPLLDYAAIPEETMIRLTDEAPIEVISRLKRRRDLPSTVRARIDDRFARPRPARETVRSDSPQQAAIPTPDASAPPEQEPAATPPPQKPDKSGPAESPASEKPVHIPAVQAPYYPDIAALGEELGDMAQRRTAFRDFVRTSSDWQWETDREGRITYLSDGAARALGRPVTALLDRPLMDVVHGSEGITGQAAMAIQQVLDRRSAFDELSVATQGFDGSCAWKLAAVPLFDLDSGRFQGYRGIAEAMTSSPALGLPANSNAPSRRAKSEATRPAFDSGVAGAVQSLSHELKTPLNAILGFSEMIELETWGKINDDYRRSVRSIIEAAKQLNELISDILENAKLQSRFDGLYPKLFLLSPAVTEAIGAVDDHASRRKISIEPPAQGPRIIVYSDPRLVHYSLVRLLRSALEDSGTPGEITLALITRDDGSVDIDIQFRPDAEGTAASGNLSPLSRFRVNLARELAALIGATVSEQGSRDSHTLTLHLPPHDRFPVTE